MDEIDLHARHSRIHFNIIKDDDFLIVRVSQGKPPNGNIATRERLAEVGKEVYSEYAKDRKLIIMWTLILSLW